MRRSPATLLSRFTFLAAPTILALLAASVSQDAAAGWPPPKNATRADVKDPANWPNDPGYGYQAADLASNRRDGQWNLYGFIPDRSKNAPPIRPDEFASGMSVDLAWRNTIGDSRVKIAVLDSGIKWDEADLADKAYLNIGELANHKPHHADGTACGGDGALAGFDCNGDGVLSVSDYADEPLLTPDASDGHPKGDRNNNGILDAGDLILNFSDGVDDDGNGYIDDISGWDFMKDDNDPYDDTRYGHGTGEARDSSAAANNGIGDAGVCPMCRFIPCRVGDSFIANVQDYAQAVMFATDSGANVIQEALGTINLSSFAQAAMDYAYAHNVTVVSSMADENSRHSNMPATANHTLPVHAITKVGSDQSTMAKSFYGFHTCSNYGGHNLLSAPGDGCSSEATGKTSGAMGLIYSAAVQSNLTPALTAGEAQQLLLMTTDDINVPESHEPNSPYYWSQPGFDTRFGYGRVDVDNGVTWVLEGRIPPAVDMTYPTWYTVLYKDRVTAPIDIRGTVSAKRANSYDYFVEWAPGVQPLDGDFQAIPNASVTNVPSTTVSGANGPLAQLEIRGLTIDNPPDPDDTANRENRHTITVRVRAVAHYGGTVGDVPGQMRRTYYVYEDPDLLPGFPIYEAATPNGTSSGESSPKLADIDGDGVRDIVSANADGLIHVWKMTASGPQELAGFPFHTDRIYGLNPDATKRDKTIPDYTSAKGYSGTGGVSTDLARETFVGSPAVGDIDGDGKPEIIGASWEGTLYVVRSDGTAMPGWPVYLPRVPSCPLDPKATRPDPCMDVQHRLDRGTFGSPVLADMDKDGKLEIVQAAFDGKVYVYKSDGKLLDGWPVDVHYTNKLVDNEEYGRVLTTPTVADFNGDGYPDVLVGSGERLGQGGNAGAIYLIDGRGNKAGSPPYLPNWPVTMSSMAVFPLISEGVCNAGAAADFNGDGVPEAVMHGTASAPLILPTDPGTQSNLATMPSNALPDRGVDENGTPQRGIEPTSIFGDMSKANTPDTFFPLFAQPSVGDLNQDGTPDVTASGGSLSLAENLAGGSSSGTKGQNLLAMWDGKTGAMFPGSPVPIEDYTFFNNQVIADVSGDNYPEVITGTGAYFVRAADACGREAEGFPKFTGQWIVSTVAVGDIVGDGELDLVVNTRNGWMYAWKTKGRTDGVIQWESFHHDNHNTGSLLTPLDQGVMLKASQPLDCAAALADGGANAASDTTEAGGGCGCIVGATSRGIGSAAAWLALAGAGIVVARRRRR